ncbi:MAG: hypothetical protein DRP83_06490 [Planctomycetota bacterium]|nr:MAG: hypothetical protein DRP83_06490 [Planctomycetota bacterium]
MPTECLAAHARSKIYFFKKDNVATNGNDIHVFGVFLGFAAFLGAIIGLMAVMKNRSFWPWALFGTCSFLIAGIAIAFVSALCPKCRKPLTNK